MCNEVHTFVLKKRQWWLCGTKSSVVSALSMLSNETTVGIAAEMSNASLNALGRCGRFRGRGR